jgi:hypothetical protein
VASQVINLKAAGLQTNYQSLMEISPGALLKATNTVINREGIIEPRRGIKTYSPSEVIASTSRPVKQLLEYKGRILRHVENRLQFDNGIGTFTSFDYSAIEEPRSGYRIKSIDSKNNLYFTTSAGVRKISEASASDINVNSVREVGVPRASIRSVKTLYQGNGNPLFGFFPEYTPTSTVYVAYRVTWSYTDKTTNLLIGAPSPRVVASNIAKESYAHTYLEIDIPSEIVNSINPTEYRYSIYRSEINIEEPTDELRLIYEANLTTGYIAANVVTFEDKVLEANRVGGIPLYSNPETGEGPTKTNEQPPLAYDLAFFEGHLFYANTRERHATQLKLETLGYYDDGQKQYPTFQNKSFSITNGDITNTYTFQGARTRYNITCPAGSAIVNYSYIKLYSSDNERVYRIIFNRTDVTPDPLLTNAGEIDIIVNVSSTTTAAQVATAIQTALSIVGSAATYDFTVTISSNILTIENKNNGTSQYFIPSPFIYTPLVTGLGEDIVNKIVLLSGNSNKEEAFRETMTSLVRVINANPNEIVRATYASNLYELQGKIVLESKSLEDLAFYLTSLDSVEMITSFTPNLSSNYSNSAIVYDNVSKTTTVTIPALIEPDIKAGDKVAIIQSSSAVNGQYVIASTQYTGSTFTYVVNGAILALTGFFGKTVSAKSISKSPQIKNRIYYSKFYQPEAVPFLNFMDVGSSEFEISRIITLRESLFVLKKDGVFRIAGEGGASPTFKSSIFDNTSLIVAPDTAVNLSNQCYFFSNQGIMRLNESSIETISRPIQDKLLPLITTNSNISTLSFSVPYETDRSFLIWTVANKTDTKASICYRYNIDTSTWTEWKITKYCGILNEHQDKLYLGGEYIEENGNVTYSVDIERKDFTRFDYADRDFTFNLTEIDLQGVELAPSSIYNFSVGDVVLQEQYVTMYQFNSLLKKLDMDMGLDVHDFYNSNIKLENGKSLSTSMSLLVARLNLADSTETYTFSGTTDFATIQTEFNTITTKLNNSIKTYFNNYLLSSGTLNYETIVISKNMSYNTVELKTEQPFIAGPMKIYKAISTEIQYAPQHAGDPSSFKQFSAGEFMFERRSFSSAIASYNSDISDNYEEITLVAKSASNYGNSEWGNESIWGGQGDQSQIRTYIPLKKQRCRFLGCKFNHAIAFENFQLYGISLSVRTYAIPDRDYR